MLALSLILIVGLLAGGAWWLADGHEGRSSGDPVLMELFASGKTLESEFLAIAAVRDPNSDDIALLGRAVENQRNWMRATGEGNPEQIARLRQMEATFESARASMLATAGRVAEDAARVAIEAGRRPEALLRLEEALHAQRELNKGHPRAEHRDLHRESRLALEIELLRVEPVAAELHQAMERAKSAREAGHLKIELEALRVARVAQEKINREFPRTKYADLANLERILVEIDSRSTEAAATTLKSVQRRAVDAAMSGQQDEAAALFAEAIALQREINTKGPKGRFASIERLDLLEGERQTALGGALAQRIRAIDKDLAGLLASGEVPAALLKISEGGTALDEFASQFPRSRQADPGLRLKFNYLTTVRDSLEGMVANVRAGVIPIPGRPGVAMHGTEVSQDLYQRVMGSNPSRAAGQSLPVDSVSWNDASEFCRRLSWVIGRVVRLPSEDEFRSAVGDGASSGPGGLVWRPPISDIRPRAVIDSPVNANGFADLLGNLAEWLDAPGTENAPVAGGSFADVPDPAGEMKIELRARADRNRATGFRFVIEGRQDPNQSIFEH